MRIIPAIDIINGQCVRLSEGRYDTKKVYYDDPLDAARSFCEKGVEYLHMVDLDGAKAGRVVNWEVLRQVAESTDLKIDFSGGIKTEQDVEAAFRYGAAQVAIGSLSAREPARVKKWIHQYGPEKIIIGADVKNGRIAVNGWQETTDKDIFDFVEEYLQAGALHFLCTDISRDGMLEGPSLGLYKILMERFPAMQLIASGGVANVKDVEQLKKAGCNAVVIGKAIYEGRIDLQAIL